MKLTQEQLLAGAAAGNTTVKNVQWIYDAVMATKPQALQSDLRTLAEAVVAFLEAHETRNDIHDFQRRFENARDSHAPAITLAQGILKEQAAATLHGLVREG